jgi:hypothetical protein
VSDDWSEVIAILNHGHGPEFQHANGLVVVAVPCLAKTPAQGIELDCDATMTKRVNHNKPGDCSGDTSNIALRSVERSKGRLEDPHRHHVAELRDPRHGHEIDSSNRDDVNVNWKL